MTDHDLRSKLTDRLAAVRARIAAACARAHRDPAGVTLVAVTKTVSPNVARLLPELGVLDLGESRPQELWRKAEALAHLPIRWHLVGHLQRNKVERTMPLVHLTHSIDSLRLFREVDAQAAKLNARPRVLLQVNISSEGQKHGFEPDELVRAAPDLVRGRVEIVGLMGMAAYSDDAERARPAFAGLRQLRDRLRREWNLTGFQLENLSMGMSGDFEVAVEQGATLVRIGTTLFAGLEGE
ncbi:MAG TPA: YggS family pyridoxal phosphate-dependent enzyme [Gemmataceae bacterium]|nr:YggS family pyridoxal phosphate-dependent enzyme [Gemmataceae bacterium]